MCVTWEGSPYFLNWNYKKMPNKRTVVKHANHMTMTTSGQIMSWPVYLKTKRNVNIKLWDLCEILVVYILLSTFESVHMVLTVNKPDERRFIAWIESADWNPWSRLPCFSETVHHFMRSRWMFLRRFMPFFMSPSTNDTIQKRAIKGFVNGNMGCKGNATKINVYLLTLWNRLILLYA